MTCRKCGWEVKQDFGLWIDTYNGSVCDWRGDVPMPHEPNRQLASA